MVGVTMFACIFAFLLHHIPHHIERQVLCLPKYSFKGGVHPLHSQHEGKLPTRNAPIRDFVSDSVVIPMSMHLGAPSKPCVSKGDHVKIGQLIGEPVGGLGLPVHASVSGEVTAVEPRLITGAGPVICVCIQNDFADWQKDAQAIIGLYKKYGICCFKIDGLQIPTKTAEQNLRRLFDTVLEQTNYEVIFNLDATAGRRGGYHYMNEYGNIFLENRYTDWGNYYPYRTLRNLWMLSRYVPAEKMQIEFLNKWRNADKYDAADPFAPARYSFDYLFAITLAAQPLAWMEASNLPEEAYITASLLKKYQPLQLRFHQGVILPIGEEPSGRSWTGFQSTVSGTQGYLVVYREDNEQARGTIDTWLPEGKKVDFIPVMGSGKKFAAKVGAQGRVSFELNDKNSFALYQYEVKP